MKKANSKFWSLFFKIAVSTMLCLITAGSIVMGVILSENNKLIRNFQNYVFSETKELPVFSIKTENSKSITSKDDYLTCNISVSNADDSYCFEDATGKIKGRGNSTWEMPKKPYKLKFDSKINLFGNGKAKTWTLIANYADNSLMRNYLAYAIGNSFDDLKFTSKTQFVDLYLNNEYQGVYLVCEQVEVNNNRVEIEDSTDALDTGYLLELDYRAKYEGDEGEEWFYSNNIPFAIKSPEIDDDNCDFEEEDFCAFIKSYMDVCFGKLNSLNYANVQDYFDVNSFADAYILNELFKNKDVGFSSFYVYKEKSDNHLHCGPIWDYDLSSGNSATKSDNNVNYLQAKHNNIFFKKLLQYDEFNELVKNKLLEYENDIRNLIDEKTSDIVENYPMSFTRNFVKWNTIEKKQRLGSREVAKLQTWKENVKFLKKWLNESLDYMMEVYCQ